MINAVALFMICISTFLAALAGVYFKKSSRTFQFNVISLIKNRQFIYGTICSVVAAIIYVLALRLEHLSKAYPATSMNYVWTIFLSHYLIGEKITFKKSIGITFIIIGIFLISYL
jgi:uncharacterized membrane protein